MEKNIGEDYQPPEKKANIALDFAIVRNAVNKFDKILDEKNSLLLDVKNKNSTLQKENINLKKTIDNTENIEYLHDIITQEYKNEIEALKIKLADWMVSQKAFKELAIQFGKQLGKTPDQVKEMGLDKEIDVLQDKNDPNHGTNVGDSTIIGPRREVLLDKALDVRNKIRANNIKTTIKKGII